MPVFLLIFVIVMGFCHEWIPTDAKSVFYALSLSIKSIVIFLLPFLIFGLIFKTSANLARKSSKVILWIIGAICLSNFCTITMSYFMGSIAYKLDLSMQLPENARELFPAWDFSLPKLIANDKAMFSGVIMGLIMGWFFPGVASKISEKAEKFVNVILKAFLILVPVFIMGFILKMYHEKQMFYILSNYSLIFSLIAATLFSYIAFLYLLTNRFNVPAAFRSAKNMLPAGITGFGSMSSAAALPFSILGAEKNADNPDLAKSIVPVTVNIHLIADCIAIPVFAFAILKSFGLPDPSYYSYFIFTLFFMMAKFSVAGVPGGSVLVMLPILEKYLGLNGTMLSLITALYMLFDPVITFGNVMGNGAFAVGLSKLFGRSVPATSENA